MFSSVRVAVKVALDQCSPFLARIAGEGAVLIVWF